MLRIETCAGGHCSSVAVLGALPSSPFGLNRQNLHRVYAYIYVCVCVCMCVRAHFQCMASSRRGLGWSAPRYGEGSGEAVDRGEAVARTLAAAQCPKLE